MSAKQIVILSATVVGLVVVVTLTKVYLGGLSGKDQGQPKVEVLQKPHLTFEHMAQSGGAWRVINPPSPFGDSKNPVAPEQETGGEGHFDYWFKNNTDQEVTLQVVKLSCNRCLHLEVALAPEGSPDGAAKEAGSALAGAFGPAGPLGEASNLAAAGRLVPGPDAAWQTLEPLELNAHAKGFVVPPKRGGWARLGWKDEEAGAKLLTIDLRTTAEKGSAPPVRLEYGATFVEPVRVLPESKLLVMQDKLRNDRPAEAWFLVYSSTRNSFKVDPEPEEEQKRKHPFVRCGKPEPLTRQQCDERQKEYKRAFLSAYKVPVKVYEHLEDGREHDLGPFRWTVGLKADATDGLIGLSVGGTVEVPEIKVLAANGEERDVQDRVSFGTFPRGSDITRKVSVEVPVGMPLKLEKVPDFLKAELGPEEAVKGARRQTWGLTVTIPANKVTGHFPNPDDPATRDTAIYLLAKDRRVRIPVSGTASQR